jgi:opine dehydrogenase
VLAPIAEGLLAIGGAILGKDLLRGERTLEALGLSQCSHEKLFRLLEG